MIRSLTCASLASPSSKGGVKNWYIPSSIMQTTQTGKVCHICLKEVNELFSPYITTQSKGNKTLISPYPTPRSCHTYWGVLPFPPGEHGGDSKLWFMEKHIIPSKILTPKCNLVLTKCSSNSDYFSYSVQKHTFVL